MSDPGLVAAKLAAAQNAIQDYLNNLPPVSALGFHVKVSDHVTPDQVGELAADVVDAVDNVEDDWAKNHSKP